MANNSDEDESSDEYKRKRQSNNLSVKKTREKQKKLVDEAKAEMDAFKIENENLKDKYESLQKELSLYKSLFTQRLDASAVASAICTNNDSNKNNNKRQRVSDAVHLPSTLQQEQSFEYNPIAADINDLLNLPQEHLASSYSSTSTSNQHHELHTSSSYSSFNVVPIDDAIPKSFVVDNDDNDFDEFSLTSITTNNNVYISEQPEAATTQRLTTNSLSTPTPFFLNEDNFQVNNSNGIISNENKISNKNNIQNSINSSVINEIRTDYEEDEEEVHDDKKKKNKEEEKNDDSYKTAKIISLAKYERKKTIPMPFHHEYAFIEKTSRKK